MGGTSKSSQTSTTQSTTQPWQQSLPAVSGLLDQTQQQLGNVNLTGTENAALAGLTANAQKGNQFAPAIGDLATGLLSGGGPDRTGMVQSSYDTLRGQLQPYTTLDTNPYSNEAFTKATGVLSDDITNRIKSQYAGAGYSPVSSGDFGKQLGEGIARGVAPTWLQANNDLENRKLGAISGLYGAGNTTAGLLSGLDQTKIGNQQAGVDVANSAIQAQNSPYAQLLAIEAQRRGIPVDALNSLSSLIVPMAQLGTQQQGTSTTQGTQTMSPAQTAAYWAQALGGSKGGGLMGVAGQGVGLLGSFL